MTITKITREQAIKILKAAAYVVASALISFVIALLQDQPEMFGVYTPFVNTALVALKQAFTSPESEE